MFFSSCQGFGSWRCLGSRFSKSLGCLVFRVLLLLGMAFGKGCFENLGFRVSAISGSRVWSG